MVTSVLNIGQEVVGEWDVSGVQSGIDGVNTRLSVIELQTLDVRLTGVEADVVTLKSDVSVIPAMNVRLTGVEVSTTSIDIRLTGVEADVVSLKAPVYLTATTGVSGLAYMPEDDDTADLGASDKRFKDIYATNDAIQTSDASQKRDITPFVEGLTFINKLNPVTFKWNSGKRTHYGFIAQEISQVTEDAVFVSSNGICGLRYSELIAPMCKAIQEINNEITALNTFNIDFNDALISYDKQLAEFSDRSDALAQYISSQDKRITDLNIGDIVPEVKECGTLKTVISLQKKLNISYILTGIAISLAVLGIIF